MLSGNSLDDEGAQYEYVPQLISPVSDGWLNPDDYRMCPPMESTIETVMCIPVAGDSDETY